MSDFDFDVVVIGGGVVGLAVSAFLSDKVPSLLLLERHEEIGRETSSRNSEVIHAGMYYAAGSLKARLSVEGRRMLYDYVARKNVPHKKCGKIIIASTDDEAASLEELKKRGENNGVEGLRMIGSEEVRTREPNVEAVAALLSEETGIIDSHSLMEAFRAEAEENGADMVFGAQVCSLSKTESGWEVGYRDSEESSAFSARVVMNAAGLGAQDVMRMAGLDPEAMNLKLHLCKGEYFSVQGAKRKLVNSLVYPSPMSNLVGLGIHTVVDLGGGLKLGPNAFYVDEIEYAVDPAHGKEFLQSACEYLPFLEEEDIVPDMSGMRPKLSGPGEAARDFHIAHEAEKGAEGFFNLVGIESPGLTASPAIAKYVGGMVVEYLTG